MWLGSTVAHAWQRRPVSVGVARGDLYLVLTAELENIISERMADKKGPSFLVKAYLLAYNGVLTAG